MPVASATAITRAMSGGPSIGAGLAVEVKSFDAVTAGCETTGARLVAISRYFFDLAVDHEAGFRAFLACWLDAWIADGSAPVAVPAGWKCSIARWMTGPKIPTPKIGHLLSGR